MNRIESNQKAGRKSVLLVCTSYTANKAKRGEMAAAKKRWEQTKRKMGTK